MRDPLRPLVTQNTLPCNSLPSSSSLPEMRVPLPPGGTTHTHTHTPMQLSSSLPEMHVPLRPGSTKRTYPHTRHAATTFCSCWGQIFARAVPGASATLQTPNCAVRVTDVHGGRAAVPHKHSESRCISPADKHSECRCIKNNWRRRRVSHTAGQARHANQTSVGQPRAFRSGALIHAAGALHAQ